MLRNPFSKSRSMPDETEAILGRHLDGDFIVFPMADRRGTTAQLEAIGSRFGVHYPAEFVAHVCGRFPGIYVEAKETVWPRPKQYDVGPFWSFLYGLHTYTPTSESEPWMRLDIVAQEFQDKTGLGGAPILAIVGDADVYCTTKHGSIVRFRHETNELETVAPGFWQVFEDEIRQLRERKDKKRAGER